MKNSTKGLVYTAVIAAIYAALTMALSPITYGAVQFRLTEALTILPMFIPEATLGLGVGCVIANIPSGPWDMLIGGVATLIAAIMTRHTRKIYFGVIPPIVVNALMVPIVFLITGTEASLAVYFASVVSVGLGQIVSVCGLGIPLYFTMKRLLPGSLRNLGKSRTSKKNTGASDDENLSNE